MKRKEYTMPISEVVVLQLSNEYLERTLAGQSKVPVGGETDDDDEDPEVDEYVLNSNQLLGNNTMCNCKYNYLQ